MCEDSCLIKLFSQKRDEAQNVFVKNFQTVSSVKDLLHKIDKTTSTEMKLRSGRPRTVRTQQNIKRVAELIGSQEDDSMSSKIEKKLKIRQEYLAALSNGSPA